MSDDQIRALGRIPAIFDGKFFRIIYNAESKLQAKCVQCGKMYSGTLKATSNFLKHISAKHPTLTSQYESYKKSYNSLPTPEQIRPTPASTSTEGVVRIQPVGMFHNTYQKEANTLVTIFIVKNALPMRIVQSVEFKEMICKIS